MEVVRGDIEVGGVKLDVWFEFRVVWEVLIVDLSLSLIYVVVYGVVSIIICYKVVKGLIRCVDWFLRNFVLFFMIY